jgi:hypothetical protein
VSRQQKRPTTRRERKSRHGNRDRRRSGAPPGRHGGWRPEWQRPRPGSPLPKPPKKRRQGGRETAQHVAARTAASTARTVADATAAKTATRLPPRRLARGRGNRSAAAAATRFRYTNAGGCSNEQQKQKRRTRVIAPAPERHRPPYGRTNRFARGGATLPNRLKHTATSPGRCRPVQRLVDNRASHAVRSRIALRTTGRAICFRRCLPPLSATPTRPQQHGVRPIRPICAAPWRGNRVASSGTLDITRHEGDDLAGSCAFARTGRRAFGRRRCDRSEHGTPEFVGDADPSAPPGVHYDLGRIFAVDRTGSHGRLGNRRRDENVLRVYFARSSVKKSKKACGAASPMLSHEFARTCIGMSATALSARYTPLPSQFALFYDRCRPATRLIGVCTRQGERAKGR